MVTLLLLASMLVLTNADDDLYAVEKRNSRKHYCGKELRLTLQFLCESIYKRSSPGSSSMHEDWGMNLIGAEEPEPQPPQPLYPFPFRPRAEAYALLPGYLRRRQTRVGVADECCAKPCTIAELSTYCGQRSKPRQ